MQQTAKGQALGVFEAKTLSGPQFIEFLVLGF